MSQEQHADDELNTSLLSNESSDSIHNLSDCESADEAELQETDSVHSSDDEFLRSPEHSIAIDRSIYRIPDSPEYEGGLLDHYIEDCDDQLMLDAEEEQTTASEVVLTDSSSSTNEPRPGFVNATLYGIPCCYVSNSSGNSFITGEGFIDSTNEDIVVPGKFNVLASTMGSGKTHYAKALLERFRNNKAIIGLQQSDVLNVLFVSNTRALGRQIARSMNLPCYLDMPDLLGLVKHWPVTESCSMSICINSLWKLKRLWERYHVVVFDEIVGCIDSVMGELFEDKNARISALHMMKKLLDPRRSLGCNNTTLVMDAMIGEREMHFFRHYILDDDVSYFNVFRFYPDVVGSNLPQVTAVSDLNSFVKRLTVDLLVDKKMTTDQGAKRDRRRVVMTGMKQYMQDITRLIETGDNNLIDALGIDQETYSSMQAHPFQWFTAETDHSMITHLLANETDLNGIPNFGYSPVFNSGANFKENDPYDHGWAMFGTHMSPQSCVQMMLRVRCILEGITVNIVSKIPHIPFDLNFGVVRDLIKTFKQLPKQSRDVLIAAAGLETSGRRRIENYFNVALPDYLLDLMAYTALNQLQFLANPYGKFSDVMRVNHPSWTMIHSAEECKGPRVNRTFVTKAIELSGPMFAKGLIETSRGPVLTGDPDGFEARCNKLGVTGNYELSQLKIVTNIAMNNMRDIKDLLVSRFCLVLGNLKLVEQMLLTATAAKEAYTTINSQISLCFMMTDLFKALGWDNHIVTVSKVNDRRTSSYSYISLRMMEYATLEIDVHLIYGRWKKLFPWMQSYRTTLACEGISSLEDDVRIKPSPKDISTMVAIVLACMGLMGIAYLDKTEKKELNPRRKRQDKMRKKLTAIRRDCLANPDGCWKEVCEDGSHGTQLLTAYHYIIDKDNLYRMIDVSMRAEFLNVLSNPNPLERVHAYYFNEFLIDRAGPPPVEEQLAKALTSFFKTTLHREYEKLFATPSFWFVTNPADYDAIGVLETVYDTSRRLVDGFWEINGVPGIMIL